MDLFVTTTHTGRCYIGVNGMAFLRKNLKVPRENVYMLEMQCSLSKSPGHLIKNVLSSRPSVRYSK